MLVVPLVEGHGEVSAFPELLRRIAAAQGRYDVSIGQPYRSYRSNLVKPEKLRDLLDAVHQLRKPDAVLVLFDADDDCPKELHDLLATVCRESPVNCELVVANREYEAWFLAGMESLKQCSGVRESAIDDDEAELHRDCKGRVAKQMDESYIETLHQTKFSAALDLQAASARSRSFRRLEKAVTTLLSATPL